MEMSNLPAARLHKKKLAASTSKYNKNSSIELEERKTNHPQKPADVILDSQFNCVKKIPTASSKIQKARSYRHAGNKNILSTKPLVKTKTKRTKFPEITEALETQTTEMKLDHEIQVQQRDEITSLVINQANSIPSLKPEDQEPEKKLKAAPEIDQKLRQSSTENLKGQQEVGVLEKISKTGKRDGALEVTSSTSNSPPQKTVKERKRLRNLPMKLAKLDYDEATDKCGLEDTSPCIKDVDGLTLKDLKTIAKNQKLPGYYKLHKAELQKRLGLAL